jgi:hypothetical protein
MSGTSALEDGRSDHLHLRWGKLRRLRSDDESSVSIAASRITPDAPLEVVWPFYDYSWCVLIAMQDSPTDAASLIHA